MPQLKNKVNLNKGFAKFLYYVYRPKRTLKLILTKPFFKEETGVEVSKNVLKEIEANLAKSSNGI